MQVHKSVCFLLVCAILGLLARADPIGIRDARNIDENTIGQIDNANDTISSVETDRWTKELSVFQKGLMVEDDDGNPVEITLNEGGEGHDADHTVSGKLQKRVFFRLYTRKNPTSYQPLWLGDKSALERSTFNPEKPTHFVTHGWINSGDSAVCTNVRDAWLKNNDFNVIVVDWSRITRRPYLWASRHVVIVGQYVAQMINFLQTDAGLDPQKTTLAGHSLGAHVMGLAGYYSRDTVHSVIGLDPALPMFAFAGIGSRISNEDARHVQIIHTNAGFLGFEAEIGHTDFYPNGGSKQIGCIFDIGGACSHARSWKFFAESINSQKGFYGKPCGSFLAYVRGECDNGKPAVMGGPLIDFTKIGKFFLSTTAQSPFAKGQ